MKRCLLMLCILLLFVHGALADDGVLSYAVVNNPDASARLNLREAPDAAARSLGLFYNGLYVKVISDFGDGWVQVNIGGTLGYMKKAYLQFNYLSSPVKAVSPTMTVNGQNGTYLLSDAANTDSAILYLAKGTQVTVLGTMGQYQYVQVGGLTGYIATSALSGTTSSTSTSTSSNWNDGPVGAHATADWTISYSLPTAIVNNPDAADRLHLRKSPSTSASSLGKYYNGVRVIVLGGAENGFTHVAIGNESGYQLEGYMKTEFLAFDSTPKSAMPEITVKISKGQAKLYQSRNTSSTVLGQYDNGTKAALLGFSGDWAHVLINGQIGFMQVKYLK